MAKSGSDNDDTSHSFGGEVGVFAEIRYVNRFAVSLSWRYHQQMNQSLLLEFIQAYVHLKPAPRAQCTRNQVRK